ncbi:MAG: ribose transport system ATP-binding protein [Pseudonocardiales bacterium]|nr:ribose transport system ATP-binding protein [Pseudonocardiales bacterium]
MTATTTAGFTASSISKRYGQTLALDEVTVSLVPGEVTALVGHNGAGKSTLLRMLAGAETPDRGGLLLDGAPLHFSAPADALNAGIACVYQELRMINQLTVAQNVFLGHETTRRGRLARAEMNSRTAELCREYGVDVPPTTRAGELPVAQRQIVEVIAALNRRVRYLLLDEPTTALEAHQIEHLLTTVKRVSRERQLGVLLVDHKLDEVFSVADRVIGLSNGRVVLSGPADTVSHRDVVQAIVGESASAEGITPEGPRAELSVARSEQRADRREAIVLSAEHVATDRLKDVTLHAEAGEVLGLYGLVGSGRSRFLRTVYGSERLSAGSLTLGGAPYVPASPGDAIRSGIAFLSEERKADGFIPAMSARENVPLPVLRRFSRAGQLQRRRIAEAARSALSEVAVRGDIDQPITRLSGGNQQKVLFARAVLQHPRLLLLDEPTKGVDIGAKAEIHSLIRSMAVDRGVTVVLVSTEEEELIGLADTVCVFRDGSCDGTRHARGSVTPADLRRLAWPSSAPASSG